MRNIDICVLQPSVAYQPGVDYKVGTEVQSKDSGETFSEVPLVKGVEDEDNSNVTQ